MIRYILNVGTQVEIKEKTKDEIKAHHDILRKRIQIGEFYPDISNASYEKIFFNPTAFNFNIYIKEEGFICETLMASCVVSRIKHEKTWEIVEGLYYKVSDASEIYNSRLFLIKHVPTEPDSHPWLAIILSPFAMEEKRSEKIDSVVNLAEGFAMVYFEFKFKE